MIESLDGRLLPSHWSPTETPLDVSALYEGVAKRLDGRGFIIGRTTMAEYGEGVEEGAPAAKRPAGASAPEPFTGDWKGGDIGVAFDSKAKLTFTTNRLPNGEHLVVVLPRDVGEAHLERLRGAGVSYVFEGEGTDDRARITGALNRIAAGVPFLQVGEECGTNSQDETYIGEDHFPSLSNVLCHK